MTKESNAGKGGDREAVEVVAWADNVALGRLSAGRQTVVFAKNETIEYSIGIMTVAQHERIVAAITAQQGASVAVPDGYALVPVDRSYDMRIAAILHYNTAKHDGKDHDDALNAAWLATLAKAHAPEGVIAAAPSPASLNPVAPSPVSGLVEALETVVQMCRNEYTNNAIQQEAEGALADYRATGGDV